VSSSKKTMKMAATIFILSNIMNAPAIAQECAREVIDSKNMYQLKKPLIALMDKRNEAKKAGETNLANYYQNKFQAYLIYGYYRAGKKNFAIDVYNSHQLAKCLREGEFPGREDCGLGTNQASFNVTKIFYKKDIDRERALSVIPVRPTETTKAFVRKYLGSCALPMPVHTPKTQTVVRRKAPPPPPRPTIGKYPLSVCNESAKTVSYWQRMPGQTVSSNGNSYRRYASPYARAWRDDWNKRRAAGKISCDGIPEYIYSFVMKSRASAQRQAEYDRRYGERRARERAKWNNYKSRYPSNSYMGNASGSASAPAGAISSSEAYSNAKANSATTCKNTGGSNCDR
jgi:hypothetical protein